MKQTISLIFFVFAASLHAKVTLAPLFADGAVLQREKPVPIWGTSDPGERISVAFAGQILQTTADADGHWRVNLAALATTVTGRDLVVKGADTVTLHDVLVGEVWIASGQSNMEFSLSRTDVSTANYPLLRQFKVAHQSSYTPHTTLDGSWASAVPASAAKFSAVAYFFGLELYQKLNVPVGIINSSWGGTGVNAWIDPDTYRANSEWSRKFESQEKALHVTPEKTAAYEQALADWNKGKADAKAANQPFAKAAPKPPAGTASHTTMAGLYNGMIRPLEPYAVRGFIWYQGESNHAQTKEYAPLFSAMITGWRKRFAQGDLPFYWVQLPNFDFGNRNQDTWQWAQLREGQTQTLKLPNTGQAITIDVGEAKALHPPKKKPVGERLARLALARTYAMKGVIDSGPVFAAATHAGGTYHITYQPSTSTLKAAPAGLTGFELAGEDKVFHDAEATIEGASVIVSSAAVPAPVAVRYAYRNAPVAGLFNAEGLPAAPFRTDAW
ncbi:MAG: sialate O-acetylesterase [Luteolibacter sp.]